VFTVKIPKNDNVSILKDLIKEKNAPHLNKVAAKDLDLTQVSLPVDDDLEEVLKKVDLVPLTPLLPISQVFPHVEVDRLHIVVQAPPKGQPISAVLHIAVGLIEVFRRFYYQ
jgi:hypothetical protein